MSDDKFEIKITSDSDGNDTKLGALTLKESKALVVLLAAMNKIVEISENHDKLVINVREGSAAIAMVGAPVKDIQSYFYNVRDSKSADSNLVEAFRDIQNVFVQNGLSYKANFYLDGLKTDVFNDFTKHRTFRTKTIRRNPQVELVFLKGELLEVGGVKPNFHILNSKGEKIKIDCKVNDATRVNLLLYKDIYISSWRSKKPGYKVSYKFCDHYKSKDDFDYYKSIIQFDEDIDHLEYVSKINDELKAILKSKNLIAARAFLKMFNHNSVENSVLKMILILTKYFKDNSNIMDIRESIKNILEKKRKSKLI